MTGETLLENRAYFPSALEPDSDDPHDAKVEHQCPSKALGLASGLQIEQCINSPAHQVSDHKVVDRTHLQPSVVGPEQRRYEQRHVLERIRLAALTTQDLQFQRRQFLGLTFSDQGLHPEARVDVGPSALHLVRFGEIDCVPMRDGGEQQREWYTCPRQVVQGVLAARDRRNDVFGERKRVDGR